MKDVVNSMLSPVAIFRLMFVLLAACCGTSVSAQSLIQVPSQATLQQAISQVTDGGVIEITNAGTYPAPAGGFQASNLAKSFTIRAQSGVNVVLSGSGTGDILRIANASQAQGRTITLQGLTFSNGRSTTTGLGGAISLVLARVNFVNCTFQNNIAQPTGGGGGGAIQAGSSDITIVGSTFTTNSARISADGGAIRATNSRLLLLDSTFNGNDAWLSGGAISMFNGSLFIHNSIFDNNRANPPNHNPNSLGGAITLADTQLRVTNSRFMNNQAGYSGGAIYAFGYWTTATPTDVIVANSTFQGNAVKRDPTVVGTGITLAGAIQVEDQVVMKIYNSRFFGNNAELGGAINSYRSVVDVRDSVFRFNYARGLAPGAALGGAIAAASEDNDSIDGPVNRPSTSVTIRNSLFEGGNDGSGTPTTRLGGCVFVAGDPVRAYGLNGNAQLGTVASNRAPVVISDSIFYNCDVKENQGGGFGGGAIFHMASVQINDTIFAGCDALGGAANTGSGGAIMMYDNTDANIQRSHFVAGRAGFVGGAISSQGSNLQVSESNFQGNSLVGANPWGGAAIWTGWENLGAPRPGVNATGLVSNSIFSGNTGGAALLEYDSANAPFNLMRYASNVVFPNDTTFFSNPFTTAQTAAQLNSVVLHGTAKAPQPNTGQGSAPVVLAMLAAPRKALATYAPGDVAGTQLTRTYLGYIWNGSGASLDGVPLSSKIGLVDAVPANHILAVDGSFNTVSITVAGTQTTQLRARPAKIGPNQTTRLFWTMFVGNPLTQFIDQGVNLVSPPTTGSMIVNPQNMTTTYRGLLVTEEGGAVDMATVSYAADRIFGDGLE